MPQIKVQDSDGREHQLIGPAVFGLAVNGHNIYVAKIVCRTPEYLRPLIQSILVYLIENYGDIAADAMRELAAGYQVKQERVDL